MSDGRWAGQVWVRPGLIVVEGAIGVARPHSHRTVQVISAVDGVEIGDGGGARAVCSAAVIPPNTLHEVVSGVGSGRVVQVEPESVAGVRLVSRVREPLDVMGWVKAGGELCSDPDWFAEIGRTVGVAANSLRHPAVSRVLAVLPRRIEAGPIRLAELAGEVRLSESRLAHVFSSEVGLPLRPYVRWLRMQRAIGFIAEGATLTVAAHGAGFADSAHLSRVCSGMFGCPPSHFAGMRWITELE